VIKVYLPKRRLVVDSVASPRRGTLSGALPVENPLEAYLPSRLEGAPMSKIALATTVVALLVTANHGWMQVETPAGSGWTYGSYLAPVGSAVVVQQPAPPQEIIAR